MNRCFFIGKVYSNIKFDFILNGKSISIVICDIKLLDGNIIKVKGYDEIADYCYSKLKYGDVVNIEGIINNRMEIIIKMLNR